MTTQAFVFKAKGRTYATASLDYSEPMKLYRLRINGWNGKKLSKLTQDKKEAMEMVESYAKEEGLTFAMIAEPLRDGPAPTWKIA